MARITIHEALCEAKISDKRIDKAIQECAFCAANKEVSPKIAGVPVKEYEDEIRSKYQAITDLIKRNDAIKKALSLSNAATKINVAGIEMSVAEAIYMMQHGITHKQRLLMSMVQALKSARSVIEFENGARLEERLDKFIQATYGSKEKVTAEELDKASKDFKTRNEFKLIDPIGIVDKIAVLTEDIDKFQAAVDSAIQISNATTYIEIPD